jgi:hypothetical protein
MHSRLAGRECAVPDLRFQMLLRPAAPKNAVPAFCVFMHSSRFVAGAAIALTMVSMLLSRQVYSVRFVL